MRDERFIRGEVPMTKSEVRAVSLSKLELKRESVCYDIGAGTGSVSVEMALTAELGRVYAVEQKEAAACLVERNRERFSVPNLAVVRGRAPEVLSGLEPPTHAFIGGTSGRLGSVLDALWEKNPRVRVVLNVIALESLSLALSCLKERKIDPEVVSVQVARAEKTGPYHLMKGENPVYILSFGGGT